MKEIRRLPDKPPPPKRPPPPELEQPELKKTTYT